MNVKNLIKLYTNHYFPTEKHSLLLSFHYFSFLFNKLLKHTFLLTRTVSEMYVVNTSVCFLHSFMFAESKLEHNLIAAFLHGCCCQMPGFILSIMKDTGNLGANGWIITWNILFHK